jgi:hypothetical protein
MHRQNKAIFGGIKGKFKDDVKLKLRSRCKELETRGPMRFHHRTEQDRIAEGTKAIYDTEGFNRSFYQSYKFRDGPSPDKILDDKGFCLATKSRFETFEQLRMALESKSATSKSSDGVK